MHKDKYMPKSRYISLGMIYIFSLYYDFYRTYLLGRVTDFFCLDSPSGFRLKQKIKNHFNDYLA